MEESRTGFVIGGGKVDTDKEECLMGVERRMEKALI
jgi:hypothetical protein